MEGARAHRGLDQGDRRLVGESPATIEGATFYGGEHSTGLSLSLSYEGTTARGAGTTSSSGSSEPRPRWEPRPPRIIINGTSFPDLVRMELDFGHVGEQGPGLQDLAGEIGAMESMADHPTRSPTGIAPVLQLHPTRRCNIACAHCYSVSGPTARGELPPELLLGCLDDRPASGTGSSPSRAASR